MKINSIIAERLKESIEVKNRILSDEGFMAKIQEASDIVRDALLKGNKILLCGNGGSASDALHIAGEFVGRFQKDRHSLPAICLNDSLVSTTTLLPINLLLAGSGSNCPAARMKAIASSLEEARNACSPGFPSTIS